MLRFGAFSSWRKSDAAKNLVVGHRLRSRLPYHWGVSFTSTGFRQPLLEAACEKFSGTLSLPELFGKLSLENGTQNRTMGTIHSLTGFAREQWGSTPHKGGGTDEDALEDNDVYVDLGENYIQ